MARDRRRVMLESGPKLDMRRLPLKANTLFWTNWQYSSGLVVKIRANLGSRWGSIDLEHDSQRQTVHLEGLPRHFGGCQWYAICPRTGRRTLTLWMPPGSPIFASRHAWPRQVAYKTQFEDMVGRAWSAKARVARRLGGDDPSGYVLPRKPRWMRWPTFDKLAERYYQAEDAIDYACARKLASLLRRYPGVSV